MLKKRLIYSLTAVAVAAFLAGCYEFNKKAVPQESVFVVWKTPVMKYADQGFIYAGPDALRMEIYASGQAVMRLVVKAGSICNGALCMSKKSFNMRYLSPNYPDTLLERVLAGRAIFGSAGMKKTEGGFVQKIDREGLCRIEYTVTENRTEFRDALNRITIKITKNH